MLIQTCYTVIATCTPIANYKIVVYSFKITTTLKVAVYQRGVAEVGYTIKTARRLENESKLDEAELACTENDGIHC